MKDTDAINMYKSMRETLGKEGRGTKGVVDWYYQRIQITMVLAANTYTHFFPSLFLHPATLLLFFSSLLPLPLSFSLPLSFPPSSLSLPHPPGLCGHGAHHDRQALQTSGRHRVVMEEPEHSMHCMCPCSQLDPNFSSIFPVPFPLPSSLHSYAGPLARSVVLCTKKTRKDSWLLSLRYVESSLIPRPPPFFFSFSLCSV